MRFFLFSLPILLLCSVSFSQTPSETGLVRGKVVDKASKALEAATVSLHRLPDSALITGNRTAQDGSYEFKIVTAGTYYVEARMIGYLRVNTKQFVVSALTLPLNLPMIKLTEQVKTLKGVSVTVTKPFIERQADKLVVNVESSIVSTGSTALEVLQRTPGITLDKDDHIQLKGKQGVTVMLDGKLTYLSADQISNLLKNMASENISRIEVITNPSSKYDAAGNTGIINIITKKGKKAGLNGNVTARLSEGRVPKTNTGLSLNYKTSHFNFFGDLNYSWRDTYNTRYKYSLYNASPLVANELSSIEPGYGRHALYKAGVDINLSKNKTLSLTVNGYQGLFGRKGLGTSKNYNSNPGKQDTTDTTATTQHDPYHSITYALAYRHTLDSTGQELSADADYTLSGDKGMNTTLTSTPLTGLPPMHYNNTLSQINHQPSNISIRTAKADYTLPVDSSFKLEAGVKASWVQSHNDFTYDSLSNGAPVRPARENNFIYTERILAAYVNSTVKWKKYTLAAGLRLENTRSSGDLVTTGSVNARNYTDLFPSASLTDKINDANGLSLSITRRINRPDYDNISPYLFFLDKSTFFIGNPALKPEYTYQYELSYTFKQKYIATLSYGLTKNYVNEFALFNTASRITEYTVINFDKQTSYNATLSAPGDFTPWWTSTNSLSLNYNQYLTPLIVSGNGGGSGSVGGIGNGVEQARALGLASLNLNIIETFKLPHDWKAEVNAFYNSPTYDGTYHQKSQNALGAGLQKTFWLKRADLKLNATDIFNTLHFEGRSVYNNVNLFISNKWESRRFTLAFTYRFGGPSTSNSKKKSGSEENSRLGSKG